MTMFRRVWEAAQSIKGKKAAKSIQTVVYLKYLKYINEIHKIIFRATEASRFLDYPSGSSGKPRPSSFLNGSNGGSFPGVSDMQRIQIRMNHDEIFGSINRFTAGFGNTFAQFQFPNWWLYRTHVGHQTCVVRAI